MYRSDDNNEDNNSGMVTAVAALALALEENGTLKGQAYGDALRRLWDTMPKEKAVGESGAVIEKILAVLADAKTGRPTGNRDGEAATAEAAILRVA